MDQVFSSSMSQEKKRQSRDKAENDGKQIKLELKIICKKKVE
jgi:hypothetical protein